MVIRAGQLFLILFTDNYACRFEGIGTTLPMCVAFSSPPYSLQRTTFPQTRPQCHLIDGLNYQSGSHEPVLIVTTQRMTVVEMNAS